MEDKESKALVAVGTVARAQGRHGEVVVNPLTDFPERFARLDRVLLRRRGTVVPARVESFRLHGGRPVLKLAGIGDIAAAEGLAGQEVCILEEELLPLEPGAYYHFQIVGCEVWDRREGRLGRVEELLETGGTDVLVVRSEGGREVLVPFCREFCRRVDEAARRIETELPEELVHLNAD